MKEVAQTAGRFPGATEHGKREAKRCPPHGLDLMLRGKDRAFRCPWSLGTRVSKPGLGGARHAPVTPFLFSF